MVHSSSRDNRRSDQEKRFQSIPFHRCNSKVKSSIIGVSHKNADFQKAPTKQFIKGIYLVDSQIVFRFLR